MRKHIKILLTTTITIFILLGFAVPVNMVGNWTQQFMPNLNGKQITDITFLDSLNGYAVATQTSDSSYILKTTNGGDNWQIIYRQFFAMTHVQFLNTSTGFAGGGYLYKTTNGGLNWTQINTPASTVEKMYVLNDSTIWFINSDGLTGGVFYTSNGGASWTQQLALGSMNPEKIYMYNADTGFVAKNIAGTPYIRRTTNGGQNWSIFVNGKGFSDMFFVNSLTGWTAYDSVRKTTNGGINWITQILPYGGMISNFSTITKFNFLNKDTIWGIGGYVIFPNSQVRGIIYRTVNGGANWLFQVPDTSVTLAQYYYINFTDESHGWAYHTIGRGVHTVMGGDPIWLTGIKQISTEIPKEYKLYQNYPNPFNPKTNIKYQIVRNVKSRQGGTGSETSNVKLIVYDIQGKEIITLVNEEQSAGTYEIDFTGSGYSSGIYFYTLLIDNKLIETKRMVLIK